MAEYLPALIEVRAKLGTDCALLDHLQRRRQGARPQQRRQIARGLDREVSFDLTRSTENGLADYRRGDHLVVQHDGEALVHMRAGHFAELARAHAVEFEIDDGLSALLAERTGGVSQPVAAYHNALLDDDGLRRRTLLRAVFVEQLRADRDDALLCLLRVCRFIHQLECHLRGLAEKIDQPLRIGEARHLNQDAVFTLPFDGRLARTKLVDAAAHDFDRLVHDLLAHFRQIAFRHLEADGVVPRLRELVGALAGAEQRAAGDRVQAFENCQRVAVMRGIENPHRNRIALRLEIGVSDVRFPQPEADIAHQRFQPLLLDLIELNFLEQIRAALQVESEGNRVCRHPFRHLGKRGRRNGVRQRKQQAGQQNDADKNAQPCRNLKHGYSLSFAGWFLGLTSLMRAFQHFRVNAIRNLHRDVLIFRLHRLGDGGDVPAGGDHRVATAHVGDGGAELLHPLLLRAHQHEVHHHQYEN